jgi:streptogramin lyase
VGPFCDIECSSDASCPTGSWCENKRCTTKTDSSDCLDPDNDGYCDCCDKGKECDGGEGNASIYPGAPELCDGLDNDCDTVIDTPSCVVGSQGVGGDDPFAASGTRGGITQNPDGSLSLGSTHVATDFAWPSNDGEGTVSRIDTILDVEVGRYVTVLRIPGGNPSDPGNVPPVHDWYDNRRCNRPSRSTVDLAGNAYVANRAHEGGGCVPQGSVTKIGLYDADLCAMSLDACQCKDRNNNGTIETSRDLDGDGQISLDEADGEFLGYDDECVLWTVPVGPSNSIARAMAIDAYGFVWVGDWQGRKIYKLDPMDGSLVNPSDPTQPATGDGISVAGQPYGAVIDSQGNLWYVNASGTGDIQRVDTLTGSVSPINTDNPVGGYGITIDRKDRVWLASYGDNLGGGTVARYNPTTSTWTSFSAGLSGADWRGRGIAATVAGGTDTGAGVVWAVFHTGAQAHLVGFDDESGAVWDDVDLAAACGAHTCIGAGIGSGGGIWIVNQNSNNTCRYDPDTREVVEIPIGTAPYTYSDFTGNVLRTFTSPQGTYRLIAEGCPNGEPRVVWTLVTWQAGTPGASSLTVQVRNADTVSGLALAPIHGPATQPPDRAFDLASLALEARYLEVIVTLKADDNGNVPTLFSLSIGRECTEDPA